MDVVKIVTYRLTANLVDNAIRRRGRNVE